MPTSRDTIVVRDLPETTTAADVQTFFDTRIRNANTLVFPLVADSQRSAGRLKCATVELNHSGKAQALGYNGAEFIPSAGGKKGRIQVDASLIGAVTLASHNNPEFDVYFVHGVGGDVFSSWVNDSSRHMWIRDSFPGQCLNLGVRGRFSALGYNAKIHDKKEKSIQHAAEEVLNHVKADRPANCTIPIFFVCHSLGGIVVTQALAYALAKPAIKPEFQFIQQMVRGVAYFGTPFQGSRNADYMAPIASLYGSITRASTSFVDDLKTYQSDKLPSLMMSFNNIRNEEGIDILVFIENLTDGPAKVTTRTSATLPFTPPVVPIGINAGHRDMVKFASAREARETITAIVNMIKGKLDKPIIPEFRNMSLGKALPELQAPGYEGKNTVERDDSTRFSRLALFDTIFVIDDTGSMQMAANSTESTTPGKKTRWDVLTNSMQYMGKIAAEYDPDGVDIQFLISSELNASNVKSGQDVLNLLSQVDLEKGVGGTYFAAVLAEILGPYVARYTDYFEAKKRQEKAEKVRPLNIIILTDGKADDAKSTKKTIVKIGKQLDKMNAPDSQVGIQFLQVGDDEAAAKWLKELDDDLEDLHDVRDYVDTRTFNHPENSPDFTKNLRAILLGAIDREID